MQNWDVALEDLNRLKDTIESTVSFCVRGQLNLWGLKFPRAAHNFVGAVYTPCVNKHFNFYYLPTDLAASLWFIN